MVKILNIYTTNKGHDSSPHQIDLDDMQILIHKGAPPSELLETKVKDLATGEYVDVCACIDPDELKDLADNTSSGENAASVNLYYDEVVHRVRRAVEAVNKPPNVKDENAVESLSWRKANRKTSEDSEEEPGSEASENNSSNENFEGGLSGGDKPTFYKVDPFPDPDPPESRNVDKMKSMVKEVLTESPVETPVYLGCPGIGRIASKTQEEVVRSVVTAVHGLNSPASTTHLNLSRGQALG